jgi:ubiquitin-protein ligase E3 B
VSSVSALKSVDAELYRNLIFIKRYQGDIADLGLTFSTMEDVFGRKQLVELKPNGSHIDVNQSNCTLIFHYTFTFKFESIKVKFMLIDMSIFQTCNISF